jgi:hypothetical protein
MYVLWTMCTNTLSNEEITKIKVVGIDESYNFSIYYFFQNISFRVSKFGLNLSLFKFSQMTRWLK